MKSLFSFNGRVGRGPYWGRVIATTVVIILAFLFLGHATPFTQYPAVIVIIGAWISGIATTTKRWHDRGKSGLWFFIGLIPIIGGLWALIECGFLSGEPEANRYGPPV